MTEALGVKAERIAKSRGGEMMRTRQMILHFEDDLPQHVSMSTMNGSDSRSVVVVVVVVKSICKAPH